MRRVTFGTIANRQDPKAVQKFILDALAEIERASQDDIQQVAQDFTVSNFTATRTLNAGTASATDVANVLCTFLNDMKNRGSKRNQ